MLERNGGILPPALTDMAEFVAIMALLVQKAEGEVFPDQEKLGDVFKKQADQVIEAQDTLKGDEYDKRGSALCVTQLRELGRRMANLCVHKCGTLPVYIVSERNLPPFVKKLFLGAEAELASVEDLPDKKN